MAGAYYIVAARLAEPVENACGIKVDDRIPLSPEALKALDGRDIFAHPFVARDVRLMYGEHVTDQLVIESAPILDPCFIPRLT